MQVFPITITQLDINTFLRLNGEVSGRSLTRELDKTTETVASQKGQLLLLESFGNNSAQALSHLYYGFFITADERVLWRCMFQGLTSLLNEEGTALILTGNLSTWATAILNGCQESVSIELRQIFNMIFFFFEQVGFRQILWPKHQKQTIKDGTFILK